jgi:ABC-type dipeptide/oligopeptide/nickel transport system ATPase component
VHQKLSWKAAWQRAVELLRMVRIGAPEVRVKHYPHELSGGMRQRASSAAAIGPLPALLIADEPTTALDVTTQRQYLDLLKEIQAETGIAIIFVTHDMSITDGVPVPSTLRVCHRGLLQRRPTAGVPITGCASSQMLAAGGRACRRAC